MIQLLLPLSVAPRFTFESLVVHSGIEAAYRTIVSTYGRGGPPFPSLFLHGPQGTGKTHLLRALTSLLDTRSPEKKLGAVFAEPHGTPPRFPDLEQTVSTAEDPSRHACVLAVDDAHLLSERDTAALWTLWNQLTRVGTPLILASRLPPIETFPENEHLRSRVTAGLVFELAPPEDHARMLIVDKIARDKNVRIPQEVSRYLVTRKSRNIKELERLVELLDHASLEMRRRITLPLVRMLEDEKLL
jgi:chromosomal replication initiation ATPase DnaA